MSGWMRIERNFLDHPLFAEQARSQAEAYLWLLSHAAWAPTSHRIGLQCHDVPRGSLFTTERQLKTIWNWSSRTKVMNFLRLLERNRLIELKTAAGKTQITICNYEHYCGFPTTEKPGEGQDKAIKDRNINITPRDAAAKQPDIQSEMLAALCLVLDRDHAAALIRHRAELHKPLTLQAARLLAVKFARCADPAAAVDTMIANGWQGFEPHWLDRFQPRPIAVPPARQHPPQAKRNIGDAFIEEARRLGVMPDANQSADAWRADFIADRAAKSSKS